MCVLISLDETLCVFLVLTGMGSRQGGNEKNQKTWVEFVTGGSEKDAMENKETQSSNNSYIVSHLSKQKKSSSNHLNIVSHLIKHKKSSSKYLRER